VSSDSGAEIMDNRIGITTTIPIELVFAAGKVPVDLNNVFINSPDPISAVQTAEYDGYPRNVCGWIKGIYATTLSSGIKTLIAAVEGDCSQTHAMMETLEIRGIEVIPFSFPYGRDRDLLRAHIRKLAEKLGTDWDTAEEWKRRLDEVRSLAWRLDEMTWRENKVLGSENHLYQIRCSDFEGNPNKYAEELRQFLNSAEGRQGDSVKLRLGYIGIPPIFTDLYEFLESLGARVVFNEVQRQFTMPHETDDLVEQYALYTYPYDVFTRIADIKQEIVRRDIHGIIHYTQSFCFRQIQDIIIRGQIDVPILTIEGENPTKLDGRTRVRIESFLEMLERRCATW
jgi:benzoyl-CoA reductase/2-hydroxyglutaryl-CoA dehydratase subunit BcrC/BadD/HgdB